MLTRAHFVAQPLFVVKDPDGFVSGSDLGHLCPLVAPLAWAFDSALAPSEGAIVFALFLFAAADSCVAILKNPALNCHWESQALFLTLAKSGSNAT